MVYATPEAICDVLGAKKGEDRERCLKPLQQFETITETLVEYKEENLTKALNAKPITAIIWAQDGCPFCEEEIHTMVRAMVKHPDFAAYAVDCDSPGFSEWADRENVEKTPTTSFYRAGSTKPVLVLEGRKSPEEVDMIIENLRKGDIARTADGKGQACSRNVSSGNLAACFTSAALGTSRTQT
jgi:hypothetical protein